jgi:hypothetical protein
MELSDEKYMMNYLTSELYFKHCNHLTTGMASENPADQHLEPTARPDTVEN